MVTGYEAVYRASAMLARYYAQLLKHLAFPFQALYAETNPPVRQLVRYITVTGLLPVFGSASRGIHCKVEGLAHVRELPLVDIGVQEDNPNCQTRQFASVPSSMRTAASFTLPRFTRPKMASLTRFWSVTFTAPS